MTGYDLTRARSSVQQAVMAEYDASGLCAFCPPVLGGDSQAALLVTTWWTVTASRFPYDGAELHLLLVPRVHDVADLLDLPEEAQREMWAVLDWVRRHHGLRAWALLARSGELKYTNGSVAHAHLHVITGDVRVSLTAR